MDRSRKAARFAGVLFIFATVVSLVGSNFIKPILGAPDYLVAISTSKNHFVVGILIQFLGSLASAGIAVALFSTLRKFNEGLAVGAVVFRMIEAVFYIIGNLSLLSLLSLSQSAASTGTGSNSATLNLGSLLQSTHDYSGFVFGAGSFCIGALMYYLIFFQSKLIPQWLSGWGLASIALLFTMVLLIMFGSEPSGKLLFLAAPLGLQEMVLALWLIIKGFDPVVLAEEAKQSR